LSTAELLTSRQRASLATPATPPGTMLIRDRVYAELQRVDFTAM
jgi:hypothetical protein